MKTIIIPISNAFFVRNFLRGGFLDRFPDCHFTFLVSSEKIAYYQKEFMYPNSTFLVTPPLRHRRIEKFFKTVEAASIPTRFNRLVNWFHLKRRGGKTRLPLRLVAFLWRGVLRRLGTFSSWRKLIRLAYGRFREPALAAFLSRERPDLVFCPTIVYGVEAALLREANRLDIGTIAMTSNWDNLYSKTLLRVHPKLLLVQTSLMKKTAGNFCDFPAEKIVVTGVPQYDRYFKPKPHVRGREDFIKSLGGNPSRKLLLYAFSGKVTADLDYAMLEALRRLKRRMGDTLDVLIRPYPKHDFPPARIARLRKEYGFLVKESAERVGEGKDSWEFNDQSLAYLMESLTHADMVVTVCSTFFVEAAVFDKPLIAIGFDPSPVDYWNSSRRFFDWEHLSDIRALGGVSIAKSENEFSELVQRYAREPDYLEEGRKKIVIQQCEFLDGATVERVTQIIRNQLSL